MKRGLAIMITLLLGLVIVTSALADTPNATTTTAQELTQDYNRKELQPEDQQSTFFLYDLFKLGGALMWLLLAFAVISFAYILERFWYFSNHQFKIEPLIRDYIKECKQHDCAWGKQMAAKHPKNDLLKILEFAGTKEKLRLDHVEKIVSSRLGVVISKLERGLNVLAAIGSLAPLTGFLGTVSGMIAAFRTIANADQVNARMVAGGIFEALITTAFGLIIAIITMSAYNYFVYKIENFAKTCEELANEYLEELAEHQEG